MKLTLTARIGSIFSYEDEETNDIIVNYTVRLWYDSVCYTTDGTMILSKTDDIPVQGDGIAIEFDVETKEIIVL